MVNATHGCAGRKGPGSTPAYRGSGRGTWLAAAALAVVVGALPCADGAFAQTKKSQAKKTSEAPAQVDTAAAQRAYAGGTKAFDAGDMAGAEQQLSVALAGGGLPNSQMARALYLRGAASRRLGKPAQAISDLTTAMWLKGGLSESDKTKVAEERQLAYREAGLGDTPPPIGAAPLDQSPKTPATPAAATPASGAQIVQVQPQSFWNNFSMPSLPSLTGSSQPAQPAAAPGATTAQTAEAGSQSSFWSFLSPSSPPADASAQPTPPAADGTAQITVTQGPVADAAAPAAASHSSWDTQTAAAAEASAAQQLSAGYAPAVPSSAAPVAAPSMGYAPTHETAGINPMGVQADASAPQASSISNPLEGTGTAVSNFFGNMFGGSSGASAQSGSAAVTTGSTEHPGQWGPDTTVVTAQTSSMVQRGPDSPPPSKPDALPWGAASASADASPPQAAAVKTAATGVVGKYKLQVAAVRSREEAERLAQTLNGYQPVRDGMVTPEIDEAVIGSMGTFYRVRLGPYADAAEPGQLCKTLKPQGFDCLVVTQ